MSRFLISITTLAIFAGASAIEAKGKPDWAGKGAQNQATSQGQSLSQSQGYSQGQSQGKSQANRPQPGGKPTINIQQAVQACLAQGMRYDPRAQGCAARSGISNQNANAHQNAQNSRRPAHAGQQGRPSFAGQQGRPAFVLNLLPDPAKNASQGRGKAFQVQLPDNVDPRTLGWLNNPRSPQEHSAAVAQRCAIFGSLSRTIADPALQQFLVTSCR